MADYLILTGLGACKEIGRSCFLLTTSKYKVLLDCGANFEENRFPLIEQVVDPKDIDLIILTHAHLDHSGYIPALCEQGFKGPIVASKYTMILSKILWEDVYRLQTHPSFSLKAIEITLSLWRRLEINESFRSGPFEITFLRAGHILGAVMVDIAYKNTRLLYTADISSSTFIEPSCDFSRANQYDYIISESTYAGTVRKSRAAIAEEMLTAIKDCLQRSGTVLIPTFGVARAQEVLSIVGNIFTPGYSKNSESDKKKPKLAKKDRSSTPIIIDGMVKDINNIYLAAYGHKPELSYLRDKFSFFKYPTSDEARQKLIQTEGPKIIVSTSGMLKGKAKWYFDHLSDDSNNLLLFVGYQAANTPGATIFHNPESVNIDIGYYSLSAHADQSTLINLFSDIPMECLYLVHGEEKQARTLMNLASTFATKDCKILDLLQEENILKTERTISVDKYSPKKTNSLGVDINKANFSPEQTHRRRSQTSSMLFNINSSQFFDHSLDFHDAITKINHISSILKSSNRYIFLHEVLSKLSEYSLSSIEIIKYIGKILFSGPVSLNIKFSEIFYLAGKSENAITILEYLSANAKKGGGFIKIEDDILAQLINYSVDTPQAVNRLGRILNAGNAEIFIDIIHMLKSFSDSNIAVQYLEYLSQSARAGGSIIRLSNNTLNQLVTHSIDSNHAIDSLARIFKAGSIDLEIDYKEMVNISIDTSHASDRLEHLAKKAKMGLTCFDYINKKFDKKYKNIITQQIEKEENQKKDYIEVIDQVYTEIIDEESKGCGSIIRFNRNTFNQVIRASADVSQAIQRLENILNSGSVSILIEYGEVLNYSNNSEQAVTRIERLANEAKKGGGIIKLDANIFQDLFKSSLDSEHAIERIGTIFEKGSAEIDIDYNNILKASFNTEHAFNRLKYLANKAKDGILKPIENESRILKEKIHEIQMKNAGTQFVQIEERKNIETISKETFEEIYKKYEKNKLSRLSFPTSFYKQVLRNHPYIDKTINMLGDLLSSGPVDIPLNYRQIEKDCSNSDQAIPKMTFLAERSMVWEAELKEKMSELRRNTLYYNLLKEGYLEHEIKDQWTDLCSITP